MRNLKLFIFLLCFTVCTCAQQLSVTATCYQAVPEQCNNDVQHTATMFVLNLDNPYSHRILAVSRDLEVLGFRMNTKVLITGAGKYDGEWVIRDRMARRWTNKIDFLVNIDMFVSKWDNVKIVKI